MTAINMVDNCLIVSLNGDIDEAEMLLIQKEILDNIKDLSAKNVLVDLSALQIIDTQVFSSLKNTAVMIAILGAKVVFAGIQPGVASTLVDLDVDFGTIVTSVTMNDGLELLKSQKYFYL